MIQQYLSQARKPCVFFSGGMDSLVVLDLVRREKPDIDVIVFKQDMMPEQWRIVENVVKLWNLTVISCPPSHSYVISRGEGLARVDEYNLSGLLVPVVRDFVHSDRCCFDLNERRLVVFPFDYDVAFVGHNKNDPYLAERLEPIGAETAIGSTLFVAPLWEWAKQEIAEAAADLPYAKEFYDLGDERYDTGNLIACSNCLVSGNDEAWCPKEQKMIPRYQWDAPAMTTAYRTRFGIGGNHA